MPAPTRTAPPTPTATATATRTPTPTPTPGGGSTSATNCPRPAVCSSVNCPTSTNWVNPLNYGAVGDGAHDDTAALQAATNAGDVCFPSGKTFLINNLMSIDTAGRHWQAGMIGGAAPVLSNTINNLNRASIFINASNVSVIGLDFEGPSSTAGSPAFWGPPPVEWNIAIEIEGVSGAGSALIAGNTFNGWDGDDEVIAYGGNTCGAGNNTVEYNTFKKCGGYGWVDDATQGDLAQFNTSTDCGEGQENDNLSQCIGGNTWNHETLTEINGNGYQVQGYGSDTCLTGGTAPPGTNYSGNLVENSSMSGPNSCLQESVPSGGIGAVYTNDSCSSGCTIK